MDGNGSVKQEVVDNMMVLSNLIFLHFHHYDKSDHQSQQDLIAAILKIKESNPTIKICVLIRDSIETGVVQQLDYPEWLKPLTSEIQLVI